MLPFAMGPVDAAQHHTSLQGMIQKERFHAILWYNIEIGEGPSIEHAEDDVLWPWLHWMEENNFWV